MKITVRFFAISRELTGTDHMELECSEAMTVSDAVAIISDKHPELDALINSIRYAVDDEYADGDYVLKNGQELSFIPPVSGG